MPSVRRKIPWTRKPPLGTGVDWSNPLAQGLYYALPMAEGSALPQEIVQGATVTKTGSPTWTNDPGINFGAVTNYYALPAWNPTTITLLVMVYGGATGATQLTWWSRQFTTSLVPWMLSGNIATTGGMAAYNGVWNATNTAANPYVTTNYNDGLWHVIVGTSDGANLRYFIDGIQQGVKTFAANLPSNTSPVYLCQYLQNSAGFTGLMSLALAWGRCFLLRTSPVYRVIPGRSSSLHRDRCYGVTSTTFPARLARAACRLAAVGALLAHLRSDVPRKAASSPGRRSRPSATA